MAPRAGGILPFFIDWRNGAHPAAAAPAEIELTDFHAQHPDPDSVALPLRALGVDLRVERGPAPALFAVLRSVARTVILT